MNPQAVFERLLLIQGEVLNDLLELPGVDKDVVIAEYLRHVAPAFRNFCDVLTASKPEPIRGPGGVRNFSGNIK